MKCKQTRKALSRYLDHELCSTQAASVEEHLTQCPGCRTELSRQQRLWTLLGEAEPIRSPDLTAAIEARLSAPRGWAELLAGLRLGSLGWATVTAALVGLFVWTGVWAGSARHDADGHDRAFLELLSDAPPPGMEFVAVLEQIGEQP